MSTTAVQSDDRATAGEIAAPTAARLTNRQRFINACHCRAVDRPPLWLMRQAGRALPEYRKLKEKYTFLDMVQSPELAAEVTLQPIRRFGFDAAILFSDILVIPEAMGQSYRFRETGGVVMDFTVRDRADIARLSVERVTERLGYVDKALRLLRQELGDQTALIGFSGSPWTLATFMMEGGSAEKYTRARALFREDPKTYFAFAEKLTAAVAGYLQMQAAAGVDALQIFDSHGGHLSASEFQEASGRWLREIVAALTRAPTSSPSPGAGASASPRPTERGQGENSPTNSRIEALNRTTPLPSLSPPSEGEERVAASRERSDPGAVQAEGNVPVIVFSLGTHGNWADLVATGANVLGIDWQFSLAEARKLLPETVALQGNLNPALLSDATPDEVACEASRLLMEMRGRPGYVFNLGHGVTPAARLENIAVLVETVRSFK